MMNQSELKESQAMLVKEMEDCHCTKCGIPIRCSNCDRRQIMIDFLQQYLDIKGFPEEINLNQAEELAKQTDYAFFAFTNGGKLE